MQISFSGGTIRIAGLAAMAVALAGCGSSMTYGTGTTPGAQTLQDVMGIASLGGKKKEVIDYSPRAPIVAPPTTETLPPPGTSTATASANWPVDPDETRRKMKQREEEEQARLGEHIGEWKYRKTPKFTLTRNKEDVSYPPATWNERKDEQKASNAEIKKMFADARGKGSFDAEGHPVRKYLTEPPATYREPDPNSPVEITEKPKKKSKFSLKNLWPF